MRQSLSYLAAGLGGAFCLSVAVRSAQAVLLTNGSLDDTYQQTIIDNAPPGPGPEDLVLPKPTAWQNIGSRAISGPYEDELSSEPWAGPAPTPVTTGTNSTFPPGAGMDAGVFFKPFTGNATEGAATGHLQQDVAVSGAAGNTFTLRGWAGAEANFLGGAQMAVEFLDAASAVIGGSTLDLVASGLLTPNGEPFSYKLYTVSAVAPAGTASVRARVSMLNAMGNPLGGGQAFVVDDFSLVPEPTSLGLIGLGGAGLFSRRHRRQVRDTNR
jgi:hypothetical protein